MCVASLLCGSWADLRPFHGLYFKRFSLFIWSLPSLWSPANRPDGSNRNNCFSSIQILIFWTLRNSTDGHTVESVNNGPVLGGHPLLSGQFSKSRFFAHTNAVFVTCITRPPLLSDRGHPVAVPCLSFFVRGWGACIKWPPLNGN